MYRVLLVIVMMLPATAHANDWTATNTALQATYTALHLADWLQTVHIAREPYYYVSEIHNGGVDQVTQHERSETNPILGRHPSESAVHVYFASTLIAHAAVSYMLPRGWRETWQAAGIGVEAWCVAGNARLGIKGGF